MRRSFLEIDQDINIHIWVKGCEGFPTQICGGKGDGMGGLGMLRLCSTSFILSVCCLSLSPSVSLMWGAEPWKHTISTCYGDS